jgi:uncharacterized Zn-binding protein involved in type VI secretion
MRKALIVQGNPTTTGGVVIGGSAFGMTDNGRPFALYGDEATCGNCKGAFKIFGTATGRCYDGRAGVIEGDLVLCPCGRNRVLAGSDPGCYYEDDSTAIASRTTAAAFPSQALGEAKHTCWCLVRDSVNGEPLANRDFVADIGGLKQSGKTDGQGYAKIETSGEQPFNIHVIFSSPKRVLKPGQGN